MSKISELSDGGAIQSGDTLIAVRSGGNVKVTYGGTTTANIDGGTIDGTVIGGSSAAAGSFTTISASGEIAANGGVAFGDNDKAIFGASDDLEIYHDGSNSWVADKGTGDLYVATNGHSLYLYDQANAKTMAQFVAGGASRLHYDNAIKIATTSTGIDVTGTVTADGLEVDGTVDVNLGSDGSNIASLSGASAGRKLDIQSFAVGASAGAGYSINATSGQGQLDFQTAGNSRLNIDAGGDISFYEDTGTTAKFFWDASAESLGIGTSSPDSKLDVSRGSSGEIARFTSPNGTNSYITIGRDGSTSEGFTAGYNSSNGDCILTAIAATHPIIFKQSTTERMRIDSSGNLLVGNTIANPASGFSNQRGFGYTNSTGKVEIATTANDAVIEIGKNNATDGALAIFRKEGTAVGSISVTASTTAYNITSDERLKENIVDTTHTVDINDIKVRQYDWKSNGEHQRYGFIAQELEAVYPEAVFSPEDPEEMKAVDYSKLVPLLVKEIQDLKAEVAALKGA